jgi:hypothetical protein
MDAVKIPANYLAFTALGAGIPFGSLNLVSTVDEQATGYVTPPQGHIIIGEIPCILPDTLITTEKPFGVISTPPTRGRPATRSNLDKPKARRVLFGTPQQAWRQTLPVQDLTVAGSSSPPADDLVESFDRVISHMADTITICEATLGTSHSKCFPFGLKSTAASVIAEKVKRDLAEIPAPELVEYHSNDDLSRFVNVVLSPI